MLGGGGVHPTSSTVCIQSWSWQPEKQTVWYVGTLCRSFFDGLTLSGTTTHTEHVPSQALHHQTVALCWWQVRRRRARMDASQLMPATAAWFCGGCAVRRAVLTQSCHTGFRTRRTEAKQLVR